jgi:hypothetical protein
MEPSSSQFSNVSSLDAKRQEVAASKSPFGPISSGQVKPETRSSVETKPASETKPTPEED